MKDEIVGGIRNALERGESLEQAVQSLINAGYHPSEVREAAVIAVPSATNILQPASTPSSPVSEAPALPSQPQQRTLQSSPSVLPLIKQQPQGLSQRPITPPPKGKKVVIILLVIFLILLALFITSMMYGDQILNKIFNK